MSTQDAPVLGVELVLACIRRYREHQQSPILPITRRDIGPGDWDFDFSAEATVQGLFDNPARSILRLRAREAAWAAFARGGMAEMHRLFDAVEEADPRCGGVLDKWFDGVGTWVA